MPLNVTHHVCWGTSLCVFPGHYFHVWFSVSEKLIIPCAQVVEPFFPRQPSGGFGESVLWAASVAQELD